MARTGRLTTSIVAGAAVLATSAGVAQASAPRVQTAIRAQDKRVLESRAVRKILATGQVTRAELPKIIVEFGSLQRKLDHAAFVVSRSSAPTARDRIGRTEWVAGKRIAARAIGDYIVAFKDVEHGHRAAARTEGVRAAKLIIAADRLIIRADRTLRLPIGS